MVTGPISKGIWLPSITPHRCWLLEGAGWDDWQLQQLCADGHIYSLSGELLSPQPALAFLCCCSQNSQHPSPLLHPASSCWDLGVGQHPQQFQGSCSLGAASLQGLALEPQVCTYSAPGLWGLILSAWLPLVPGHACPLQPALSFGVKPNICLNLGVPKMISNRFLENQQLSGRQKPQQTLIWASPSAQWSSHPALTGQQESLVGMQ